MTRRRLDAELVRRALAPSRTEAARLVAEGRVLVGGAVADKPGRQVGPGEPVVVAGPPPRWVGRGGDKLAAALEHFDLDVAGARCLDAGASTGGFTDCLLQAGAAEVVALDVGHGQLHERLRADARVVVRERTNVRHLPPGDAGDGGGPVEVVVADLSFISLTVVLPALLGALAPGGSAVVLVKPQFEVGRAEASRGRGVITDPALWGSSLHQVLAAASAAGASIMGAMVSPLRGADGNVELLAHLALPPLPPRRSDRSRPVADLDALVAEVVADAVAGAVGPGSP